MCCVLRQGTLPQLPLSTQVLNGELLEYGPARSSGTRALTIVGCIRILQVAVMMYMIKRFGTTVKSAI